MVRVIYRATTMKSCIDIAKCIAVQWGGWPTSIQGIEGGSLLLLLVLAVKNEGGVGSFFLEKDEERG
jgi:hypothetical protein